MNGEEWNEQIIRYAISFLSRDDCPFKIIGKNPDPYCPFLGPFVPEPNLEKKLEEARNHCPFVGEELNSQGYVSCKKYVGSLKKSYQT